MKLEHSYQIFEQYSNTKFNENPASGSLVVPRGLTDMTELISLFAIYAKALKIVIIHAH